MAKKVTKMQKGGAKDSNLSMRQRREIKYVDKMRNKQIKKLEKKGTADDPQLLIDFENRKATYGDKTRREYINEKANSTINSLKKGTLLPPRMEYRYNPGTRTSSDKMQKGGSTVQQVKKETDAILKRQDAITREQNIKAAKSSSDYYKSRANDLRKVQKVYPTVNRFNELKNEYNKKAVEANKEKVELNASKYKKTGGSTKMKKGGSTGDKKWIQKAINPKHKGYCTPMSKPTCTPKRKALAKTLKAMAKNR